MSDTKLSKKKDQNEPFSNSKDQSIVSSTKSTNNSVSNHNQSQSKHSQQNFDDDEITEEEKVTQTKIVNKANDNNNTESIISIHNMIMNIPTQ